MPNDTWKVLSRTIKDTPFFYKFDATFYGKGDTSIIVIHENDNLSVMRAKNEHAFASFISRSYNVHNMVILCSNGSAEGWLVHAVQKIYDEDIQLDINNELNRFILKKALKEVP